MWRKIGGIDGEALATARLGRKREMAKGDCPSPSAITILEWHEIPACKRSAD